MQSKSSRKRYVLIESIQVQLSDILSFLRTRRGTLSLAMNFRDMCGRSLPRDALLSLRV